MSCQPGFQAEHDNHRGRRGCVENRTDSKLFYNCQRLHSGLGYATPLEIYREKQEELALAA